MRPMVSVILAAILVTGLGPAPAAGATKIKVIASLPDLKALSEAVGGDLVEVDALARGPLNPHDIEVRPSLMVKLRRADLLVRPLRRCRRGGARRNAAGRAKCEYHAGAFDRHIRFTPFRHPGLFYALVHAVHRQGRV